MRQSGFHGTTAINTTTGKNRSTVFNFEWSYSSSWIKTTLHSMINSTTGTSKNSAPQLDVFIHYGHGQVTLSKSSAWLAKSQALQMHCSGSNRQNGTTKKLPWSIFSKTLTWFHPFTSPTCKETDVQFKWHYHQFLASRAPWRAKNAFVSMKL